MHNKRRLQKENRKKPNKISKIFRGILSKSAVFFEIVAITVYLDISHSTIDPWLYQTIRENSCLFLPFIDVDMDVHMRISANNDH